MTKSSASRRRHPSVRFVPTAVSGPPEHALLDIAGAGELLVVGTPGHGFLDAWRLGAVAHEALRRTPCPVVLVPRPGRRRSLGGSWSASTCREER